MCFAGRNGSVCPAKGLSGTGFGAMYGTCRFLRTIWVDGVFRLSDIVMDQVTLRGRPVFLEEMKQYDFSITDNRFP